mgnify:FL=1
MKTADQVKKEISRKYNKDPRGWRVWASRDRQDNINWIFQQDRSFWMIKEFMVNPYETIGVGGRTKDSFTQSPGPSYLSFGLRSIPERAALELLETSDPVLRTLKTSKLMINIPPSPIDRLQEDYVLHGPVIVAPKSLDDLSYKQRALHRKLEQELLNLKNRRLPHLYGMYM